MLSSPRGKTSFDFHDFCTSLSFTIIGTHNGSHPEHATLDNPWTKIRDAEFFFDIVADGEIELDRLISHKVRFTEALDMYRMHLEDRSKAMGVILEWE